MAKAKSVLAQDTLAALAERYADECGLGELTMAAFAKYVGAPTSSLYRMIDGLDGLLRLLAVRGLHGLLDALTLATVGHAGADAVARMMMAHRKYAKEHPGLYAAITRRWDVNDAARMALSDRWLTILQATIDEYGFEGDERLHASRLIFSLLHGFASAENAGLFSVRQFGVSTDRSFERLIALATAGLRAIEEQRETGQLAQPHDGI